MPRSISTPRHFLSFYPPKKTLKITTLVYFCSFLLHSPQVPLEDRLSVSHICDLRDLAVALIEKCTMDPDADFYNGEDGQPSNVDPVFTVSDGSGARAPECALQYVAVTLLGRRTSSTFRWNTSSTFRQKYAWQFQTEKRLALLGRNYAWHFFGQNYGWMMSSSNRGTTKHHWNPHTIGDFTKKKS